MIADQVLGADGERTELGSVTVIHGWVRRGLGAALLPEFAVAEDLDSGALVRHPVETPDIALRLVWRADREGSVRELLYAAARTHHSCGRDRPGRGVEAQHVCDRTWSCHDRMWLMCSETSAGRIMSPPARWARSWSRRNETGTPP